MLKIIVVIIALQIIALLPQALIGQPGLDRLTIFDKGQHESFLDVFHCADGGLVMCGVSSQNLDDLWPYHSPGYPYVVRVDRDFEVIWEFSYDMGVPATATSIIEADNGDFLVGVLGDPYGFSRREESSWLCESTPMAS